MHCAIIREGMTQLDIHNNTIVNNRLRAIDSAYLEKIEYFCNNYQSLDSMPECLLKAIKPEYKMPNKKKQNILQKSATELMIEYRLNNQANERSYGTARTNILDFRKFLESTKIPDLLSSMTKDIAARYAEWLKAQDISINTANQRIRALATNLKNLTTIPDLNYTYPLPAKLPLLKQTITGDELEDNEIALTEEQIEILYKLTDLTDEEAVARDMFCLQCWTGVRVSDLSQVLCSANLKTIEGEAFTIFRPEKTKNSKNLRAIIPLSKLFPAAIDIVKKYLDKTPRFIKSRKNNYNELIRAICRHAQFNETRTKTIDSGRGKHSETVPLWQLISSHKGRHSFVTNCKKRGIPENEIIKMTGHATTVQIKKTYDNTDAEDNALLLLKTLCPGKAETEDSRLQANNESQAITNIQTKPIPAVLSVRDLRTSLADAVDLKNGYGPQISETFMNLRLMVVSEPDFEGKEELIEWIGRLLAVTVPYVNVNAVYLEVAMPQIISKADFDENFKERWSFADIFECLKTLKFEWACAILGRMPMSGAQYDAAINAIKTHQIEVFIQNIQELNTTELTWLCELALSLAADSDKFEQYLFAIQDSLSVISRLLPTKANENISNLLFISENAEILIGDLQEDSLTENFISLFGVCGGAMLEQYERETSIELKRALKLILNRPEAKILIEYDACSIESDMIDNDSFTNLSYMSDEVIRDHKTDDFFTPVKAKFIAGGDEKLKKLINYLAQANIDNSEDTKKMIAYRLTGKNRPSNLIPIHWHTRGAVNNGYDLIYLLQNIAERGGKRLEDKMRKFFIGPVFPSPIAQYASSASRDFREMLHSLYPDIFIL